MRPAETSGHARTSPETLAEQYTRVRTLTLRLCLGLSTEDYVVQSMPDVSPAKWHLAHVTWFFERFVLETFAPQYRHYSEQYHYLFNSYYVSAGDMHARGRRGLLSRPTVDEVLAYRRYIDEHMLALLEQHADDAELAERVALGLNHEQQHQELLLT
ncbi:MAG: DinB family protein, partial [Woeseia sp.]